MKKLVFIITLIFSFFFFDTLNVSATGGSCIIKQQNNTYEVSTPFYWYTVIKETTVSSLLVPTITYNHTYNYIETNDDCISINNSLPLYEKGIYNNALNNRITNFYFNTTFIEDSNSIYDKSISIFKNPSSFNNSDLTITSTYLSIDNMPPIIATDTIDTTLIVSVDEIINVNNIKNKIIAYDEVDGILDIKIEIDDYSTNYNILGLYQILFSATDNSGNTSTLSINVKVIDSTKPVISGQTQINSYMSNPLTIEQIKNVLSINDNYDKNLKDFHILEDNYSPNVHNEGSFKIVLYTIDKSQNQSNNFSIMVTTIDDIAPIITGEDTYTINIKKLLDINLLLNQLSVKDNIDSSPSIEIHNDDYTSNYFKAGIYQITFVAKDKNQNYSSLFTINITTKDYDKPIFYISPKFIGVDNNSQVSIEDIITVITEINKITTDNLINSTILENNYSNNFNIPGNYILKVQYEYKDNTNIIIETNVNVNEFSYTLEESKSKNKNTPKKTLWSVIKSFFQKIWKFIKNFFLFFI